MKGIVVAIVATLVLTGCGGGGDDDGGAVDSPHDDVMNEKMSECVQQWMSEVATTSEVDLASSEQLGAANEIYLEDCGNQQIADSNIEAGYSCDGSGCYGDDGYGYDWRTVASEWACENRPDLCALTN